MSHKYSFFESLKILSAWIKSGIKYFRNVVSPKRLLYRFILIVLLPLILLQTVMVIFFFDRHWSTISRRFTYDIVGEIQTLCDIIVVGDLPDEVVPQILEKSGKNLLLKMTYYKDALLDMFKSESDADPDDQLKEVLKTLTYPARIEETNERKQIILVQLPEGVLETIVPRKRFFSSTVYVFLVWMIGSSLLLFWIAFLFMKNQVRSIERLSKAAELFGMGHDVSVFKPEGATEVKQVGLSFILMKNRIQRYLTERMAMLAGVSHDLRTPLTRMKLQLSMMTQDETVCDLQQDISEMEQMLNGYLNFARGAGQEKMQGIYLNELVGDMVEKLHKSGQRIDFHAEQKVRLYGRPNDLTRAVMNILTNAGRYAKRTQVKLGIRKNMATLIIDDDGPGIPKQKRADVFKAFYRLDESRNSQTGGVGLGMTIARDIILSHGGEITLHTSPQKGLRVVIALPL